MSTRTYNLRTRTETGTNAQSRIPTLNDRASAALARDGPPQDSSSTRDTDPVVALYSDVVASRPPSPRRENRNETSVARSTENDQLESGVLVDNSTAPNIVNSTSSDEEELPETNESHWTTVRRRRAQSLNSLNKVQNFSKKNSDVRRRLTSEQAQVVDKATTNLMEQQKEMLRRRQKKVPAP